MIKSGLVSSTQLSARWAWWLGLVLGVPGILTGNSILVSLAGVVTPLGFLLSDVSRAQSGGLTAMTAYAAAATGTCVANTAALLAANTPDRFKYFLYVSEDHVFLAMVLALAAAVVPPLVFRLANTSRTARMVADLLPRVHGEIADRQLVGWGTTLGITAVLVHWRFPYGGLGTLGAVLFLIPMFVAFALARAGTERNRRGALVAALIVALADAARGFLFGYLRGDAAAAPIAFVLGSLAGARSLRPLKDRLFLPVYVAAAAFVIYFGAFGAARGHSNGPLDRLQALEQYREQFQEQPNQRDQTVLSRLSTINQLSQVGRLVDEDGFLHGQTLSYLWYAFIPRFLWADKPTIAEGAWFAMRIGMANIRRNGEISNSINMTIPGELYLNFGWRGVLVGLAFLGWFIAALWHTTEFWSHPRNALGTAFAVYLMWPWIGLSLGADLEIVVTLIAVYLVLVAIGWILPATHRRQARVRSESMLSRTLPARQS